MFFSMLIMKIGTRRIKEKGETEMQMLISSISDSSTLGSLLKAQTPTSAAGERLTLRSLQDNPDTVTAKPHKGI